MVRYIDYKTDTISIHNSLLAFMHKRKSFEHEKELRALIWTPQHHKDKQAAEAGQPYDARPGLRISVDLPTLIKEIRIAPTAPHWVQDLVNSVVTQYGVKIDATQSDLTATPLY
jgi:hypothetical protein